jgi:hypothetical protein
MDNMVLVQVLYAGQYGSQNGDSVSLCEVTALADPLKELTADGELKREVVRRPRLKPVIKFNLLDKRRIYARVRL